MSAPLATLSVAVRKVRVRLARDDIHAALEPVSRHSEAARLCLELDDDEGLEHHLRHVVDGVRSAASKHRDLRALLSSPATAAISSEAAGMNDALTARSAGEWRAERDAAEHARRNDSRRGSPRPPLYVPAYQHGIKVLDGEELLTTQFPPRKTMMSPWLPDKGLAMIYAERGIGKTWIALSIAHAIASGGEFLCWTASRPRKVLYLDGEMPAQTLQERYAAVIRASMRDAPRENFRLAAADCQPDGLPDLASEEGQRFYDATIADAELIICDNLSTLAHGLRENEADSFGPVQSWMLAQRGAGRSVLLVHHAGKGGAQPGTSRKEDTLDTVISLSRPPGYSAAEGARFEVRFTKSRGFWGRDAEPFEARFADGVWSTSEIVSDESDRSLHAWRDQGLSVRAIADRSGLSKSEVQRRLKGEG